MAGGLVKKKKTQGGVKGYRDRTTSRDLAAPTTPPTGRDKKPSLGISIKRRETEVQKKLGDKNNAIAVPVGKKKGGGGVEIVTMRKKNSSKVWWVSFFRMKKARKGAGPKNSEGGPAGGEGKSGTGFLGW